MAKIVWALLCLVGSAVPNDVENCADGGCDDEAGFVQTRSTERRSQEWMARMEEQMSQMTKTIADQAARIDQLEIDQVAQCDFCDLVQTCVAVPTTTTTTTVGPPTVEPTQSQADVTCDQAVTFGMTLENLVENTLGKPGGRILFEHTTEIDGESIDLSITDVAKDGDYAGQDFSAYQVDERNYTGAFLNAGRISLDKAGDYMFRFQFTYSETGKPAKLPLFPVTFYDNDGGTEQITACDVDNVILVPGATLKEKYDEDSNCYQHLGANKEVNLPKDWEDLSLNQMRISVTYVYRDADQFDIGLSLGKDMRYFVFKSSKVLACADADQFGQGGGGGGNGGDDDGEGPPPPPKKKKKKKDKKADA